MGASVATFDNTMMEVVYELDDREIYNDIISEIVRTRDNLILSEQGRENLRQVYVDGPALASGEEIPFTIYAEGDDYVTKWWVAHWGWGVAFDGSINLLGTTIVAEFNDHKDILVKNISLVDYERFIIIQKYYYVSPMIGTFRVRATDATSKAKYGRRVMNLTWPLVQTRANMQSMVDAYRERFKEPVARLSTIVRGSTDALIVQILSRRISDKITLVVDKLGLTATDFFINSVEVSHSADGLLEARWMLEQVRANEAVALFTLDTSELDGPDILGW